MIKGKFKNAIMERLLVVFRTFGRIWLLPEDAFLLPLASKLKISKEEAKRKTEKFLSENLEQMNVLAKDFHFIIYPKEVPSKIIDLALEVLDKDLSGVDLIIDGYVTYDRLFGSKRLPLSDEIVYDLCKKLFEVKKFIEYKDEIYNATIIDPKGTTICDMASFVISAKIKKMTCYKVKGLMPRKDLKLALVDGNISVDVWHLFKAAVKHAPTMVPIYQTRKEFETFFKSVVPIPALSPSLLEIYQYKKEIFSEVLSLTPIYINFLEDFQLDLDKYQKLLIAQVKDPINYCKTHCANIRNYIARNGIMASTQIASILARVAIILRESFGLNIIPKEMKDLVTWMYANRHYPTKVIHEASWILFTQKRGISGDIGTLKKLYIMKLL